MELSERISDRDTPVPSSALDGALKSTRERLNRQHKTLEAAVRRAQQASQLREKLTTVKQQTQKALSKHQRQEAASRSKKPHVQRWVAGRASQRVLVVLTERTSRLTRHFNKIQSTAASSTDFLSNHVRAVGILAETLGRTWKQAQRAEALMERAQKRRRSARPEARLYLRMLALEQERLQALIDQAATLSLRWQQPSSLEQQPEAPLAAAETSVLAIPMAVAAPSRIALFTEKSRLIAQSLHKWLAHPLIDTGDPNI